MSNEEIKRTMEFILAQQAQFTVGIQKLEEERIRDAPRLARLEESFQSLVRLALITDARLDGQDLKASSLDIRIRQLGDSIDERLRAVNDILRKRFNDEKS